MEQIADFIGRQNMDDAMVIIVLTAIAFVYVFYCEVHFRENPGMSDNNQKVVIGRKGIGFCGLLFIILLLLKVGVVETAVVGWSWWWITAPLWAPTCLVFGIIAVVLVVMLVIFPVFGPSIDTIRAGGRLVDTRRKERERGSIRDADGAVDGETG